MNTYSNNKNITEEFKLIKSLENTKNNSIFFCDFVNKTKNSFYKNEKNFLFETDKQIDNSNSKLRFNNINNEILNISDNFRIKVLSSQINSYNHLTSNKFVIRSFCSENFSKEDNQYYRLIINNVDSSKIRYSDYFDLNNFMTSINGIVWNGIEFKIDTYNFQVYSLDEYFIVECTNKITYELFDKYCRLVLASFGFITGFVPMDNGYYFGYNEYNINYNQFMFTSTFIQTYRSQYSIVNLNAYDYYQNLDLNFTIENFEFQQDLKIKDLEQKLKPITRKIFETMCRKMFLNKEFSEAIFSILSVNNKNTNSLNLQCSLLSVILEMITNIIADENKEKLYAIPEKAKRKRFRKELENTAKTFFENNSLNNYEESYIKAKVDNINDITNTNKLNAPFKILNIKLTEYEEEILKYRNKFLHGESPLKNIDFQDESSNLFYIYLEMNYLVNALILKSIGYKGVVKNLAKIFLDYRDIDELKSQEYYKEL